MSSVLAPDLTGHDEIVEAITRHLVDHDDAQVEIPSVGRLQASRTAKRPRFAVFTPAESQGAGTPPPSPARNESARSLPASPALDALGATLRARLDARQGAHVPRMGSFGMQGEAPYFDQADALRARVAGRDLLPMDEAALDRALATFAAVPFGVRDLQALLASCPPGSEPEDDVLVDLPAGLPKLLRAALARSAELGNRDRLGFLVPMRREWAWTEFARGRTGPPDVFLLSNAGPWRIGPQVSLRYWVLPLKDLGTEDPMVVWCVDHATLASSPHRARLSTWMRLFALETVLGPLDPPRVARVQEAVRATCPEVKTSWPERWIGEAPDPWLRQVVLTW